MILKQKRIVITGTGAVLSAALLGVPFATGVFEARAADKTTTVETTYVATEITTKTVETETKAGPARRTAIFVENRAGAQFNDKLLSFEDQVSSQLSGKDYLIISREDVMKAKKVYPTETSPLNVRSIHTSTEVAKATAVTPNSTSKALATRTTTEVVTAGPDDQNEAANRNSLGTTADRLTSDNASALRLAQVMGANFILFVNVGSFGKETVSTKRPDLGIDMRNTTYNLRGTYKITEGYTGGGIGGGTFKSSRAIRQSDSAQTESDDLVNGLIEDAANKIVAGMLEKAANFETPAAPDKVEVAIECFVKDLAGDEISLPDIHLTEGKVENNPVKFPAMVSATVEIDGFAMGTTPARIKVFPGNHKLRLLRPGFEPVDQYFIAEEGLKLTPTMWMNQEGFKRWTDIRRFLEGLDTHRALTDAQVEVLKGKAQMLRQSGFMVKTTNAPAINIVRGGFWDYYAGR
jgi:hypothetical protein